MKERIIWSNIDLNIDDWIDDYMDANDIDISSEVDKDDVYDWMCSVNNDYIDDERCNLNKIVDGRILVIADFGRWNGSVSGYKIIESRNIRDILYDDNCDYVKWYSDGYNIRFMGHHHDGTNYYLYRIIREDRNIDNLFNDIYNGKEISKSKLNYYTKSLYKAVAEVYGW